MLLKLIHLNKFYRALKNCIKKMQLTLNKIDHTHDSKKLNFWVQFMQLNEFLFNNSKSINMYHVGF